MVTINSPLRSKNSEASADIKRFLHINGKDVRVFDNERMVVMNLKKGECVAIFDKNNKPWELSRDEKGRLNWRKL
jgi:hypothetical protein